MKNAIVKAYLLADPHTLLKTDTGPREQVVHLPEAAPDAIASVVVLEVRDPIQESPSDNIPQ